MPLDVVGRFVGHTLHLQLLDERIEILAQFGHRQSAVHADSLQPYGLSGQPCPHVRYGHAFAVAARSVNRHFFFFGATFFFFRFLR